MHTVKSMIIPKKMVLNRTKLESLVRERTVKLEKALKTAKKTIEEKSAESEAAEIAREEAEISRLYIENIIANIPSSIIVFNDKLRCKSANQTFYNTFKKEKKEILRKGIYYTLPKEAKKYEIREKLLETLKTGKLTQITSCKLGDMIYNVKCVKVVKEVILVLVDVTELVSAKERLEKAYEELKALDKMKDEFLEMTSHELKTPISSISGFIELMNDEKLGSLTDQQKEALEIMPHNIIRLKGSINKMLDITRLESLGMELNLKKVQITNIIRDLVNAFKTVAKTKNITLTTSLPKLPEVYADKEELEKVISDLIDNAIKYTDKGSVIVEAKQDKGNIIVKVKDTGKGLRKKDKEQLFTKFFQADHTKPGSGLGLTICKKIIEKHGGKVWAKSKGAGKGSTFSFTLPVKTKK